MDMKFADFIVRRSIAELKKKISENILTSFGLIAVYLNYRWVIRSVKHFQRTTDIRAKNRFRAKTTVIVQNNI